MGLEGADYGSISSTLKFLKYMEEARGINDENPNDGKSTSASSTISKGEYPTLVGLSEREQKSSVAWKWAISENTRLQGCEAKYYELETAYHNIHEAFEVFKARNSKNPLLDTISCILFVLGPLALGWLTSISDCKLKLLIGMIGAGLLLGAIIIKLAQYLKS